MDAGNGIIIATVLVLLVFLMRPSPEYPQKADELENPKPPTIIIKSNDAPQEQINQFEYLPPVYYPPGFPYYYGHRRYYSDRQRYHRRR